MTTTGNGISPARQAVALVCTVIAAVCTIAVAVIESQESKEDSRQTRYDRCLDEERDRISREGGLLDAEDLCDIHPGRP